MRTLLSRATIGAIALVVTMSLVGCDEDDGPNSAPPSDSPSAPESSSPSEPTSTATETGPVEPTLPADAQTAGKSGATAFVEYYWAVVNYARHTGDVDLLRSISDPTCAGCKGAIKSITRVYDRGGRIIGGSFQVVRSDPGQTPSGAWNVSTRVMVERSRTVDAGEYNQVVRPGEIDFLFGLDNSDGSWRTTFLDAS